MKKLSGIFLLLCLVVPFLGTYGWLKYQHRLVRMEVKRRMIDGIDKEELVRLELSKEESKKALHWKHSNEFEFNGRMYDVVEKQVTGDSVTYQCLPDNKETNLSNRLDDLVAHVMGNLPQSRENQSRLENFLRNIFYTDAFDRNAPPGSENKIYPVLPHLGYSIFFHSPPAPPPEIA